MPLLDQFRRPDRTAVPPTVASRQSSVAGSLRPGIEPDAVLAEEPDPDEVELDS